jgi:hypothetical protein
MKKFILTLIFILWVSIPAYSQTVTLIPVGSQDVSSIPVTVEQLVPGSVGYNISSTGYSYQSTSGTSVSVGDDQTVTGRPIGFTFNYWGTNYTTVNICSNGWISFTNTGGNIVGYGTNSTVPAGIHGVALDLYPSSGYYIRYQTIGTAPNRQFVVSYHMSYYSCRSSWTDFQIVLNETSNSIQINVATHPTCGNALQGLSNQANNQWAITPGRNGQNWTGTTNSSYLFEPYSTSATWTSRGTLNTNQAGQATFSNPNNYDYRVTIDVSQKFHLLSWDDLNYLMYKKANLSPVSGWDFYTIDLNNSSTFEWDDIIWGYQLITDSTYHNKYVFTAAERNAIISSPTVNFYNTYFPVQNRTEVNQNTFYIMGTGKHQTTINNLNKIQ